MNKIIWKDIDSTTIKGLLICELPPITKPKMRVQETEIDGVDGSIIEELGYESYDKSIRIGLTYNYDIDEVIEYFTGQGNIVFSNEPDKYYKARIIAEIDYERLLRFKEAVVKFRVQPFKYEYQEEETILSAQEISGTEIKITDAKITTLTVEGKSTQDGEPTPEAPVEIQSVGDEGTVEIEQTNEDSSITNNYVIPLSQPLRSLPNGVKDTIEEDGIHRRVGSVVLDGSENWYYTGGFMYILKDTLNLPQKSQGVGTSTHFIYKTTGQDIGTFKLGTNYVFMIFTGYTDVTEWGEWLSENPIQVDYELAEEVIEPFDEEQLSAINTLKNTNLESVNYISADTNLIINYVDNKIIVENIGNYVAKPIIKITGTGTIEFRLNDNTLFRYTFPENETEVIIDSQKQDAYLDTVLKNRNMSGEFPIFKKGENIITWNGTIESIKISQKSRWI